MIQIFSGRYRIAIAMLLWLIALPVAGHANCQITLQWDANDPNPDGYSLYGREAGQSYDYDVPWWQGDYTFTQCTINQLEVGKTYYFVVRAYLGDTNGDIQVSGDSNEVSFVCSNGGSGGGGSSGSGCFLQSLFSSE